MFAVALVAAATINSGSIKNLHGEELFSFGRDLGAIAPAAGDNTDDMQVAMSEVSGQPEVVSGSVEGNSGNSEEWDSGHYHDSGDLDEDGVEDNLDLNKEYDTGHTECGSYPQWIGQKVDPKAVEATGKPFRILGPGSIMTMDHSYDRITVVHDSEKIVVAVTCS